MIGHRVVPQCQQSDTAARRHPTTAERTTMFDPAIAAVIDQVDALRHQVDDHWQIPRDEALLLAQLVRIGRFRSLCEIGTSYGFSTLHLAAAAAEHGGHVHTIDINPNKTDAARRHLRQAGLADHVTLHTGDAREVLATLRPDDPFDFAFIDAAKDQSTAYFEALCPHLARRAVLVTDNAVTHAQALATFVAMLRAQPGMRSCTAAVGNGFELSIWQRDAVVN
jgi:predicted O-methyltransferase YrrM